MREARFDRIIVCLRVNNNWSQTRPKISLDEVNSQIYSYGHTKSLEKENSIKNMLSMYLDYYIYAKSRAVQVCSTAKI